MQVLYKSFVLPVTILAVFAFSGCVKDKCMKTTTAKIYTPVKESIAKVRASVKVVAPEPVHYTGKIYLMGSYILLNELNKGIHVFDNSNPTAPRQVSFLNIPGNVDMAVKGNVLYADCFRDLLAFDISNPASAVLKGKVDNLYDPVYHYGFSVGTDSVIVDYITRDTAYEYDCTATDISSPVFASDGGLIFANNASAQASYKSLVKGGSMARMTISNGHLYAISSIYLKVLDISAPEQPVFVKNTQVAGGIETIFPYGNNLFIGASDGLHIVDASDPLNPKYVNRFTHATGCDPVVIEDDKAYVTIRTGNTCMGTLNQLDVIDVKDITKPSLIKSYAMINPYGLGIDNKRLFICEGKSGLKFLDAGNTLAIKTVKVLEGIETYDVIPYDEKLLVSAKGGLYQYSYTDMANPKLLSKIPVTEK